MTRCGDDVDVATPELVAARLNVPHVDRPVFMTVAPGEGHRLLGLGLFAWSWHLVEVAIKRQDAAAGARAEADAQALERGMDAPLAQRRILLEAADRLDST